VAEIRTNVPLRLIDCVGFEPSDRRYDIVEVAIRQRPDRLARRGTSNARIRTVQLLEIPAFAFDAEGLAERVGFGLLCVL
jgi:hypothetical protein